ncbi:MAG: Putative N-acylneuraminate cytidylyltransferase [Anaerolinea thermophila]|uniref:N-acylneuraminate cytidylyltransferase n=1 Tax=Anaerolinea thermophila TaxID=167964 RepID=A0A101FXN9_9CHLR|nr:MAG: Putative N-acylneuraminate cytidylyltransferase [Anaerolinea thermophila]
MEKSRMEILAVIPARGNSKSIPRKNVKELAGFPLIAYSIAAALQSRSVTRVIVSTDDAEIAAVARQFGAEVPFMRPAEFAQDQTPDLPVFEHALIWLKENEGYEPDVVIQLRPTSPIRPKSCVDSAVAVLGEHPEADCVRGVVLAGQNPYKMWHIQSDGALAPILTVTGIKEAYNAPRQDLPLVYWQTGHIDAIRPVTILKKRSMTGDIIYPLIIDPLYTVDIDTMTDWRNAEQLVNEGYLDMVIPEMEKEQMPQKISMLIMDFDGVMTDDRVWVDEDGREMVAANRSDGMGLELVRKQLNIPIIVISKEKNPVVARRCEKLHLPYRQGVDKKASVIKTILAEQKIDPKQVAYIGNDVNDLECFDLVGYRVAPADAHESVRRKADLILQNKGGHGAVRELCDRILKEYS